MSTERERYELPPALADAAAGRDATRSTGEDRPMSAIDAVATALCNADEQRHLRLERRDGTPCRSHTNDAWAACEAVLALLQREVATVDELEPHSEVRAALRQVYGLLTAPPKDQPVIPAKNEATR